MLFLFFIPQALSLTKSELQVGIKNFLESKSKEIDSGTIDPDEIVVSVDFNEKNEEQLFIKYDSVKSNYTDIEIDKIPLGCEIYKLIVGNLDIIKDSIIFKDKIKEVLIYEKEKNKYTDYFGKLNFTKVDGEFIDETGVFHGFLSKNIKEIVSLGEITEIGFFQKKNIPKEERIRQYKLIRNMLKKIIRKKNINLYENIYQKIKKRTVFDLLLYSMAKNSKFLSKEEIYK